MSTFKIFRLLFIDSVPFRKQLRPLFCYISVVKKMHAFVLFNFLCGDYVKLNNQHVYNKYIGNKSKTRTFRELAKENVSLKVGKTDACDSVTVLFGPKLTKCEKLIITSTEDVHQTGPMVKLVAYPGT